MKPNVTTASIVSVLMATGRARLDEANRLRYRDPNKALMLAREAEEIAAQANRLMTR